MIGLRPLPAGGVENTNWSHCLRFSRFSMAPMPGMVLGVGVNRRRA